VVMQIVGYGVFTIGLAVLILGFRASVPFMRTVWREMREDR
jgi:hypothetical protein